MFVSPEPPSIDQVKPTERDEYQRVLARQAAYKYEEFVRKFPHPSVRQGMPGDRIQPYFAVLLNSPRVAAGISDLGVVYRTCGEIPGGMTHADREWVDMVVCHTLGWNWVLYVHALDAVAVGVRAEAIQALVLNQYENLTTTETVRCDFIRAVVNGTMTPTLFDALKAEAGIRACVEIAGFSAHLLTTVRLMQAFGMPDIPRGDLIEFLDMIVDGRVTPPDAKARVPAVAVGQSPT